MSEKTQMQDMTNEELVRLVTDEAFWCGEAPDSLALSEEYAEHMTNGHAAQAELLRRLSATATPTEGEEVRTIARRIARELRKGCGDNSCYFRQSQRGGMGTNGGCRCHERVAEILTTRTPQPTDAARAEAHADELSRINAAHEWCAQRGVTVTYHWVHGVPRVTVRVFGGVPMAERYTFVEAVEAARAEDDRLTEARAIAAARSGDQSPLSPAPRKEG
jgi:hypothetical protein